MIQTLNPRMVKISRTGEALARSALGHGFHGLDGKPEDLFPGLSVPEIRNILETTGLRILSAPLLAGRLNASADEWQSGMEGLSERADRAAEFGIARTTTVLLPFHELETFGTAFDECVRRLREAAAVLGPRGIRLGVEYVAQATRRAVSDKPFIHSLDGTLALLHAVNEPSVGLLLDSFHWHCAGETVKDLLALKPGQVVVAHLADAPDRPMKEQVAFERAMPGEGVADLKGYCDALENIGYDGPLVCEPFQESFKELDPETILERVSHSMATCRSNQNPLGAGLGV